MKSFKKRRRKNYEENVEIVHYILLTIHLHESFKKRRRKNYEEKEEIVHHFFLLLLLYFANNSFA
jgi:hypothetical protein